MAMRDLFAAGFESDFRDQSELFDQMTDDIDRSIYLFDRTANQAVGNLTDKQTA